MLDALRAMAGGLEPALTTEAQRHRDYLNSRLYRLDEEQRSGSIGLEESPCPRARIYRTETRVVGRELRERTRSASLSARRAERCRSERFLVSALSADDSGFWARETRCYAGLFSRP